MVSSLQPILDRNRNDPEPVGWKTQGTVNRAALFFAAKKTARTVELFVPGGQ